MCHWEINIADWQQVGEGGNGKTYVTCAESPPIGGLSAFVMVYVLLHIIDDLHQALS